MKLLYSGLQYNNYNFKKGFSFEHYNFYLSLAALPNIEIKYLPFDRILEVGKEQFNREVLAAVKDWRPDLFFAFMLSDEFDYKILDEIKKNITSVAWFADDHWRFDNYSRYYAPHFSWVITTYSGAVERYRRLGIKNVIRSQWAANTNVYKRLTTDDQQYRESVVSFVGGWSGPRQKIISAIEKAGIKTMVFGAGWPAGPVSEEKMIEIFSTSKINLGLNPAPGYFNKNSLGRLFFRRSIDKIVPDFHLLSNFRTWLRRGIPQIKGRHFEIPACGGFLLAGRADDLENYYKIGEEIAIYENPDDLIEKIRYYLEHDAEREKIAKAGYERTIRDHTYEKRFLEIFKTVGVGNK